MTAAETRMPSGQEVETLLAELRALGIRLWVENGNLGFEAPAGRFSDALKDRVRRAKPRLLAHLSPSSEPLAEEESFPAFPSQETIWLARRDRPADNSYTVMAILRLETGIDSAAVGRAVAILASRHVSLRSVFFERDGQLLQKPLAEAGPEFTVHDFSAATDPEAAIRTLGWQEFARPFDLTSGPLARFHFCRLAASGAALFMAIDHLVMDGQSLVILQRDLMAVLAAITAGREPDLPPLPASLATLATRRRESLEGPRGTMLREFWRQRIDRPEREPLPTDAPESVMAPGDGYRLVRPLGRETTAALTRLSVAGRATPTVVWVAAVAALLARYKTAGGTVTIGAPFSGRIDHDAQDQIGCFVNVLPVSSKVKHQDTFGELTTTISREMLAVMAHQDLPIDHLRRRGFAAGRNASEAFDAVAVLENGDDALFTFIEPQTMPAALKFPLVFTLSRFDNDRMVLVIEHDARRFLPARVERMAEHLERLICHAASQSDVVVGRLHLLSDKEFAQVADIFNDTHRPYPRDASLAALFRAVTARYADRAALLADGIAVTYAELDQRSDAVAAGLAARGVAAGNVVGLALDRGPAAIVATLGVLKAGAVYLPLDPGLPPRLLAQLLATTGTRRIVVDANGQDRLADLDVHLLDVDSLASETAATPIESRTGADAAYIMFTSGSTGDPKGVVVPHRAVVRLVVNADFLTLGPKDIMAQAAPMGFDAATLEIWAPLLSGAGLIFLDDEALFDPAKLAHSLAEHDVSAMWLTASLFNRVAEERPDAFLPLRQLMTGGETLSPPHVRRVMDACPDLRLVNGYGPTENTTFTTTHVIARDEADALSLPIGRPIANTRVYVLDGAGEPAPIGVWGELCAAGDGLALGYAGRDDLTGQAFATLPWREEERIYRTGDIARWRDDGVLEFAGRRDTQVKIRGHRVEIEAVEAALCRLPGVRDAAVLALGEGEARALIACIAGDATVEEEWRAALNHLLPDFMVPARFVVVPAIPVSANGKKDRRALATMVTGALRETGGRAPETDAERLVARLFAALFEDVRIDAEADFFRLGGHSLLAMRLSGLIEKETGVRPAIRDLIIARTVAGIARLIEESGERIAVLPKAAGPDFALSSGQERLWILQRLHPESAAYNVAGAFDLKGTLDVAALERALTALEERQHALRLRLIPAPGDPGGARQRLAEPGELKLEMTDVSDAVDPIADADTLMADETSRPFRLEDEAPVRMRLIGLGTSRWRLVIVLHHSICDGWSMPILLRDLAALYAREIGIAGPSLPKLSRGYEDFAEWQRAFLTGTEGRTVVEHWRAKLDPLPEPLALPTDRRRPSAKRFRGAFASFVLDTNTNEHLEAVAQAGEATPFMVLLALVQALFHRLSGQTEITLGTLAAGRERTELADLVGFFVNTLVLRQHVDPRASFTDLLKTARANCLEALANQDCPFEALVDVVGVERDTSRNPLFDVLVTWQDAALEPLALPGVKARFVEPPFPYAKFDLAFHFHRDKGRIRTLVEYDTDLFDPESVEALWARFHRLAADALSNPAGAVGGLAVMEPEERALVVDGFNATATILATRRTIPEPFLDQVAHAGRAKAVLTDTETLSYTVFARRAATVAARLRKAGTKPGVIVALCARRSADMLAGIHGILMAGAAYAPLDPDLPGKRRADMLDDLGDPIVLAAPEHRDLFPGRRVVDLDSETPRRGKVISAADDPDALAYVIFTSGSTGRPKGVGIEHHAVLNRILWMQQAFPIGPGDVILQKTPITFDVSVWELFWWSWTGAAVALPPPGAEKNPLALVDAVDRFGVTVMHFVPSMLDVFLTFLEAGQVDPSRLRGLRYVFASGEALDVRVIERFNRLLHAPFGVQLHNLYGPTEATVDVTWQPCSPWDGGDVVPIGRPIANTRIYILDSQGQPVPIGVAGEIHIGGPQVARGYVNRPDLTAEHFIADRFVSGGRLYRTGDLGRWRRDGTVEYLGRIDHQVKVRGFRIECGEVEQALESHAAVERAVVVPAQTSGFTELHAYILGDDGLKSAALRGHLRDRLPEYMLPARFFRLETLPLTDSGKLDRKALAGQPLDNRAGPVATNPLESRLMEIWRELLPAAAFGPDDGFFDAGGNSLLVIRLHERLERLWPGVFTVADLFAHATVTAQARRVAEATGSMPVRSTVEEPVKGGRVAIVGMAVRLAGFEDLGSFWHDLENGVDRVRPLPENRRDDADALLSLLGHPTSNPFREAAYLDDIFGFDPRRFRMAPMDATLIDPEQRLFLETAAAALENAGYGGAALDRRRVGVFVGGNPSSIYREAMGRLFPDRVEQVFAQNVPSNIATRLSFLKDWRGPAATVDTACSSALVAIHLACRALANGECEAAVVGAAKALPIPPGDATRLTIDSSTARTRAFAEGADGTGMGEGAIAFLLKPLERALADGDAIHAVIVGSAVNQDGASSGFAAPNPVAQAEAIRAAAAAASISLDSLSYVEAHGTGTALGDPIEVDGLTRAFAPDTVETGFARLGSVKGNYGHLDGAAGALGLAKAVLCLQYDIAPPQPFFEAPNPKIDFAHAPVVVAKTAMPLGDRGGPRRAGVSSFGLSGINCHVILEAPSAASPSFDAQNGWFVVGLSAADNEAVQRYADALRQALDRAPPFALADVAHTLAEGRQHLRHRLAICAQSVPGLIAMLADFVTTGRGAVGEVASRHGGPMAPSPALAAGEKEAWTAAQAYLAGADLAWPESAPPARRIHLPAAPFSRIRCCPDFVELAPRKAPVGLLGPAVAIRDGFAIACDVHASDFWPAAEHRLNGRPILVGMALPGMLAGAAHAIGLVGAVDVRDLRWLRPLCPDELIPGSVSLELRKAAPSGWHAVLAGRSIRGNGDPWTVFAEADLNPSDTVLLRCNLTDLRARCVQAISLPPFVPEEGPVTVTARWDCRVNLWSAPGGAEKMALLRVPVAYAGDLTRFPLHPALLDVAASLNLDGRGRVPVGCASLTITGNPLPTEVLVHAVRRTDGGDMLEADIFLVDPADGRLCLAFRGLQFVTAGIGRQPSLSIPTWISTPLAAAAPARPLVLAGTGPLAEQLDTDLKACGLLAARAASAADILALVTGDDDGVVLVPDTESDPFGWTADILRGLMAGARSRLRVLVVGQGAYVRGGDGPASPDAALAVGLTLAACHEEPLLALRYLDVDAAVPTEAIAAEFAAFDQPGNDLPIAMRRGTLRLERSIGAAPESGDARWPSTGCCVVTGGLGGLALSLATEMAAGGTVSLALLGRSGTVTGEDDEARRRREKLAALEGSGIRIRAFACDITDRAALAACLDQVRAAMGPITAVVHAAGVADGGFLVNRSASELAAVLAPKVEGARNLDILTRGDPVESFVVFGSLTGLAGAPGQSAYAAANAWLDAFAAWRRAEGRPALAIDWCALSGVGMAVRHNSGAAPGTTVTPTQAIAVWRQALATDVPQIVVIDPRLLTSLPREENRSPEATRPADTGSTGTLELALAGIWGKVLGYEVVRPDDDFYALGGDSITGMQIIDHIVRNLGHAVTLSDLFAAGTVAALAATLRGKAVPVAAGIVAAPQRSGYPVGWEQLSVLHSETAAEMGTAFNLPTLFELPADIDVARLESALTALIARHEILRTRFVRDDDEWTMEVLAPTPVHLPVVDLSATEDPVAACRNRVTRFNLADGPPVRLEILVVGGGRRALFLDIHHGLADGFTLELLAGDLATLYAGKTKEPPALQLKDYTWWSREGAGRAARESARDYWQARFQGSLPMLDLPADHRRPTVNTWRGDTVSFVLEPRTVQVLRAFAQGHGATPFSVVLAAWMALFHRLAGTSDVVVAIPADNRDAPQLRNMAGMMVALLPLRAEVRGDEPFGRLLERVHANHAEATRHRAYGLGQLLEDLAPPAAPDRTLLSEVSLSYMNFAEAEVGNLGFPMYSLSRASCKNDLSIFVRDLPDRVLVSLEYYADLFDRPRIERLGRSFAALLAGLATASPETTVADLPILDAEETAQIRGFERGAEPPLPAGQGLHALFLKQACLCPTAVAVEDSQGTSTYEELARRANGVALALIEAGVKPGDRVALHMARDRDAVAAILGIVVAGAAYVPLDPAYPAERNAFILADAGCRVVIADAAGRLALGTTFDGPIIDAATLVEREADIPPSLEGDRNPDDRAAYLMYTSGSTGQPKGVLVPQRAVIRLVIGDDYVHLSPDDRILQAGPLAFDASTLEIWGPLLNGGRICIADRNDLLDPAALAETIRRLGITVLWLTASLFNRQVEYDPASFQGLRAVLTGGEVMSMVHARRAFDACPRVIFINGYGPTENTTFTTVHRVRPEDLDFALMPIGRPIPHTRVAVLDAAGHRVPIGVWGEIHAGGLGLADGYWNAADLTARAFIDDPEHADQRLYRTGDLGRWRDDGTLEYGGRSDGQIKMRGFRIELDEIEQTLNRHPAVERAVALFDRDADEGAIIACLTVPADGRPPKPTGLRAWLGQRLPAYMVPSRWYVVEEIPVNANGKADRNHLLAGLAGRNRLAESGKGAEPPRTPSEQIVADAFTEVFGHPVEDRRANFIDLGGHSLLAIRAVNLIAQRAGTRISMADFFADPSVAGLARRITAADSTTEAITPVAPADVYPVSHAQQRLYMLHRMDRGSGAYNMVFAFRCNGGLDPVLLAAALGHLAERHETLRTGFEEREGTIVQRVIALTAPRVEVDDLRTRADVAAEALRIARHETATPFDLTRPPLLRGRVIRLADDDMLVLLVQHHIVGDGWSSRILIRELGALYASARDGTEAALAPLPINYKDFAVWQRGQDWSAAADFWRSRLDGAPDRIALPTDRPVPETQSYRGDIRRTELSSEVVTGLHDLARRLGVTLSAVGMALFAALLYRLTRQGDMVLGMGMAGRDRIEVEGLIGFFVNVLPVRLRLDDETDFDGLVRQAHGAIIEAMDQRDYPFDLLVRDVAPRRRSNRQPLINVVFEYQRFETLHAADGGGLPLRRVTPEKTGGDHAIERELARILDTTTAKHDLILFFVEEGGRAEVVLEYDTDILDAETAERWLVFFAQFAATAAAPFETVDER